MSCPICKCLYNTSNRKPVIPSCTSTTYNSDEGKVLAQFVRGSIYVRCYHTICNDCASKVTPKFKDNKFYTKSQRTVGICKCPIPSCECPYVHKPEYFVNSGVLHVLNYPPVKFTLEKIISNLSKEIEDKTKELNKIIEMSSKELIKIQCQIRDSSIELDQLQSRVHPLFEIEKKEQAIIIKNEYEQKRKDALQNLEEEMTQFRNQREKENAISQEKHSALMSYMNDTLIYSKTHTQNFISHYADIVESVSKIQTLICKKRYFSKEDSEEFNSITKILKTLDISKFVESTRYPKKPIKITNGYTYW
jgi:hypothetical protein